MEEEILLKVASLVNEIASQQQNNQKAVSIISKQIAEIKQKVETAQYPFNEDTNTLPPTTEQQDKVLEALKNRLEKALSEHKETQQRNMELEKEKDELLKLIKDYETSLETVTSKLRTYANDTLEEQSQLRQEYSTVLEAEKKATIALFMENVMLQSQISQLAKKLKVAYETTSVNDCYGERIARLEQEKRNLLEISNLSVKKKQTE